MRSAAGFGIAELCVTEEPGAPTPALTPVFWDWGCRELLHPMVKPLPYLLVHKPSTKNTTGSAGPFLKVEILTHLIANTTAKRI